MPETKWTGEHEQMAVKLEFLHGRTLTKEELVNLRLKMQTWPTEYQADIDALFACIKGLQDEYEYQYGG